MSDLRDAIAEALAEHREGPMSSGWTCRCGWEPQGDITGPGLLGEFRAHVADVIVTVVEGALDEAKPKRKLPWYPPADGYEP